MLATVDVHYLHDDGGARAAVVAFERWDDAAPSEEQVVAIDSAAPYEPGAFYKRELPCILEALVLLKRLPQIVLVDGHVWLAPGCAGLGARLLEAMPQLETVVGVAKTRFAGATMATPVLRGKSESPLFVDETGSFVDAPSRVASMHGAFRLPTLLRRVDQLSRRSAAV